jgi:hypothetical protein
MRELLEQKYNSLFETYHFEPTISSKSVSTIIKKALEDFMLQSKKPAIYCNGGHTRILMSDFMVALKKVKYIVDNYADTNDEGGFHLIKDNEIEENGIDAVVISSFKFKDSIIEGLKKNHPSIAYLNLYEILAENGINLQTDYYYYNHPYQHYHMINSIQRMLEGLKGKDELEQAYYSLITKYIHIKDFRSAVQYAHKIYEVTQTQRYAQLIVDLESLYEAEMTAAGKIGQENVLMFCIDGLRRQDLREPYMPDLAAIFRDKGFWFENAYSLSTSTFESLMPVYSGNDDLRAAYYSRSVIKEEESAFIQEAKRQKRRIFFYTDMEHYVDGEGIEYNGAFQTITEKLWSFILDAVEEKNGLYYIHSGYESHFSFANPYTKSKLISEGTGILFDFLPQKGGKLRTDYEQQHLDALRYLNDVISPLIQAVECRMLVYADHGNLVLKDKCKLEEIKKSKFIYDEELIQIPYIMCSPEMGKGTSLVLISLMSFNESMLSLLKKKKFKVPDNRYVKIARSELYNPNFRCLYGKIKQDRCLFAFEGFIFAEGYKLIVYSDGKMELLVTETDEEVEDKELMRKYQQIIRDRVTVCESGKLTMQGC